MTANTLTVTENEIEAFAHENGLKVKFVRDVMFGFCSPMERELVSRLIQDNREWNEWAGNEGRIATLLPDPLPATRTQDWEG